jgi:hypothetical protein
MSRRLVIALAACLCFVVTACSPLAQTPNTSSSSPGVSPTQSSTPAVQSRLNLTLDGVTRLRAGQEDQIAFSDVKGMLALFTSVTGASPKMTKIADLPGYSLNLTSYEWSGVKILADEKHASISVTGSTVNGVPILTDQGISVGSSRAEVVAGQGWAVGDQNGDGAADQLGLGRREVPGTQSLSHPGSTGIRFLLVIMNGNTVQEIQSPSDDFGDL